MDQRTLPLAPDKSKKANIGRNFAQQTSSSLNGRDISTLAQTSGIPSQKSSLSGASTTAALMEISKQTLPPQTSAGPLYQGQPPHYFFSPSLSVNPSSQQQPSQPSTLLQLQQIKKGFSFHEIGHIADQLFKFLKNLPNDSYILFNLTPETVAINGDNKLLFLTNKKPAIPLRYFAPEVAIGLMQKKKASIGAQALF